MAELDTDVLVVGSGPASVLEASVSSRTTVFAWSAAVLAAGAVVSALLLTHGALERDPDVAPVMAH